MASKKIPVTNAKKTVAARPAVKTEAKAVTPAPAKAPTATPAAKGSSVDAKLIADLIGSPEPICANLAALRAELAAEKSKDGAAERKKIARELEALEAGYRETHKT